MGRLPAWLVLVSGCRSEAAANTKVARIAHLPRSASRYDRPVLDVPSREQPKVFDCWPGAVAARWLFAVDRMTVALFVLVRIKRAFDPFLVDTRKAVSSLS